MAAFLLASFVRIWVLTERGKWCIIGVQIGGNGGESMSNIVYCTGWPECDKDAGNCVHRGPHEYGEYNVGDNAEAYSCLPDDCPEAYRKVRCVPRDMVESMSDIKAQELVEYVKELGHELVKLDRDHPEAALRYASEKMQAVMDEVRDYRERVEWGEREARMWEGIGETDEEDAEYG